MSSDHAAESQMRIRQRCHFHPGVEAVATDAIVDLGESGNHTIVYRRVPICRACALERKTVNTSRVEFLYSFCPQCGEEATFKDASDTFWDSHAHYWSAK